MKFLHIQTRQPSFSAIWQNIFLRPSCLPIFRVCSNIPDLDLVNALGVLVDVDVDGKVCIDVSHLVLEALGNTDDQVVDEGSDSAQSGDGLANAVVDVDGNDVRLGLGEADGDVRKVLDQLATGALNGNLASLDVHLDCSQRKESVSISLQITRVELTVECPASPASPAKFSVCSGHHITILSRAI